MSWRGMVETNHGEKEAGGPTPGYGMQLWGARSKNFNDGQELNMRGARLPALWPDELWWGGGE